MRATTAWCGFMISLAMVLGILGWMAHDLIWSQTPTPAPILRAVTNMPGLSAIVEGPCWAREILKYSAPTTTLTLSHAWVDGTLLLYRGGLLMTPGEQYQASPSTMQVTFRESLAAGVVVNALYQYRQ